MVTAPATAAGMTALEQIDSRPLTKNQKNLISLVIMGNVSEFFDMFLIGFAVSSLLKDPAWHLKGFEAGWIIAMSGLGTVIGAFIPTTLRYGFTIQGVSSFWQDVMRRSCH